MKELSLFDSFFADPFDGMFPTFNYKSVAMPKVDVKEKEDSYELDMELPGRDEKSVNVELDNNTLTISSKTEEITETNSSDEEKAEETTEIAESTEEKAVSEKTSMPEKWLIRERRMSSFSRSFTVPDDVDGEGIKATFKNGVLNIRMPRKALPSPKKISIDVA